MFKYLIAAACTVSAAPVLAQDMVSANDPATMLKILEFAGFKTDGKIDAVKIDAFNGIRTSVFLMSVRAFANAVENGADTAFPD